MGLYNWLLVFHILAAIVWVGGGIAVNVIGSRIQHAGGPAAAAFARQAEWMGSRVIAPSTMVLLGVGIAMVGVSDVWTIGQLWIVLALAGFAITAITGAAFFGPEPGRVSRLLDDRGPDDPEVRRRLRRLIVLGRLDLFLLVLIVVDMVLKPGV